MKRELELLDEEWEDEDPEVPLLEKQIESKVRKYAIKLGFLVYKFTSPSQRSVPDRLFITPAGCVAFVEFKRHGKKLTKGQQLQCKRLQGHHQIVKVIDNVEQGYKLVHALLAL